MNGESGGPVLVIGGTGFIGSHLVERLASGNRPVRVVSRRGSWPWEEIPPTAEFGELDLADESCREALPRLLENVAAVVNLAGVLYRPSLPDHAYRDLHVEGTRRLIDAMRNLPGNRPVRYVHVGTTGVLGPTGSQPLDESAEPRPATIYETTKLEGEEIALGARGESLEVVVVRPGLVYGPRDLHLLALFRSIATGTFHLIAGGRARWQPVHVEDAARGIAAALENPDCDGGVFHIAGSEMVAVADLADRIAKLLGRKGRLPDLPYPVAFAAGALLEAACRPFGADPPLSRSRVRTLTQSRLYGIDRAQRELGFFPSLDLDRGLAGTVAWYRRHGHLGGGGR